MDVSEARVWKAMRRKWRGHMQRVEAARGEAEPGTPDGVMSVGGRGIWVELKVWGTPLSPEQLAWHIDAVQREAGVVVVCQVGHGEYWMGLAEEYDALKERPPGVTMSMLLSDLSDRIWR